MEILDKLRAERERHGRHKNLVVAATGTGKTIVAAFDYRRLAQDGPLPRLLFVDEFHHAEAPTHRRLLEHLQPRELLGLITVVYGERAGAAAEAEADGASRQSAGTLDHPARARA